MKAGELGVLLGGRILLFIQKALGLIPSVMEGRINYKFLEMGLRGIKRRRAPVYTLVQDMTLGPVSSLVLYRECRRALIVSVL